MRVLLVHSDPTIFFTLQEHLGSAGHEVALATHLRDAGALLPIARPDVMVAELRLPDGHTLPLCRSAAALRAQVLLLTHSTEPAAIVAEVETFLRDGPGGRLLHQE